MLIRRRADLYQVLKDVNITVPRGHITAIVGEVGSGRKPGHKKPLPHKYSRL